MDLFVDRLWSRAIFLAFCGAVTRSNAVASTGVPDASISADLRSSSPRWQSFMPAEGDHWQAVKEEKRQGLLRGSTFYAGELDRLSVDDAPDTFLHKNLSEFKPLDHHPSYFWEALCNGTHEGAVNTSISGKPLDGWNVVTGVSCAESDLLGEGYEYTDELKARMMCGTKCAAVVDIGCNREKFKLCKVGAQEETGSANCLRWRLPDHKPYEALPRKPQELAFWKKFCNHTHTSFHKLFRRHLCANTLTLPDVTSELICAEAAKETSGCSDIFDFQAGPPAVCRCVPTGASCDAAPVTIPGDVFIHG